MKDPSPAIMNRIFGLSNSLKVFHGVLGGLNDERLMTRKKNMEQTLRKSVADDQVWIDMEKHVAEMKAHSWAMNLLGEQPMKGNSFMLMHSIWKYEDKIEKGAEESELEFAKEEINTRLKDIGTVSDGKALIALLDMVEKYIPAENRILTELKDDRSNSDFVNHLFTKSVFYKAGKAEKLD
jgi:hypothetical protein